MATWKLIDEVSEPAPTREKGNEDSCGLEGSYAWVIDGATPLDSGSVSGESAARRFSRATSAKLREIAALKDPQSLESMARAAGSHGAQKGPGGHAAIALLRREVAGFSFLVLADIFVVVDELSPLVLTDPKMSPINSEADEGVDRALADGKPFDDAVESIRELLVRQRRDRMNRDGEGTYWVLNGDERAPGHGVSGSVRLEPGTRVLVCSDGFARLAVESQLYTWRELLDGLRERRLASFLSELREVEAGRSSRRDFVRLSRFDDATAILIQ